jgi:alanyl-tRNA synthetase
LRRLIRRAVVNTDDRKLSHSSINVLVDIVANVYKDVYLNISSQLEKIKNEISRESEKFENTLAQGLKKFNWRIGDVKNGIRSQEELPPSIVFELVTSDGFPFELVKELASERGLLVDEGQFKNRFDAHRLKSREGAEHKFKGGLGDTSEKSLKYHTATHLLHQALRTVLGTHVSQKGSNITPERLRFDFTHTGKMTDEEKKKVEDIINAQIAKKLAVHRVELPKAEAEKTGALHFFGDKYGDVVSVYYIGDSIDSAFSKEFCGGPHVENIGTLGTFKIQKEEAVSAGVRRIKAVLA